MSEKQKIDHNFQQFLELLDSIEKEKNVGISENGRSTTDQETGSCQKDETSNRKNEVKSCMSSRQRLLRRPGFIYRNKTSKSSLLDNNLWEFRCGQRVLKSPGFKYKSKRSVLSPYSSYILDDLSGLSLSQERKPKICNTGVSSETNTANWFRKSSHSNLQTCSNQVKTREENHANKFLPLSDSGRIVTSFGKPNVTSKKRQLLRSPRLKTLNVNLPETEDETKQFATLFGSQSDNLTSYSDLAKLKMSCPKPDKKLSQLGMKNSPNFKKFRSNLMKQPNMRKGNRSHFENSCSYQARIENDMSVDELSFCIEDFLVLPQKMSTMAEMMYT